MKVLLIRGISAIILLFTLISCNGSGGGGGASGGSNSNQPVNLGILPNGSTIISSSGSFSINNGSSTMGTIGLSNGSPGYTGILTMSVRGVNSSYFTAKLNTNNLPVVNISPNPCILTSGSTNTTCQYTISTNSAVSNGTYLITPIFTPTTGSSQILNDINVIASGGSAPIPGNLSIMVNNSNLTVGESTTAIISLSGSIGVFTLPVNIGSSNHGILSPSPTICNLTTNNNSCAIKLNTFSSGNITLSASAPNYSTATSNIISVNSQIISGNLLVSLESTTLGYGQSTNATITLSGATGVESLPVTVASSNSNIAAVNPESCLLSSDSPSCTVTVIAESQTGTTTLTASAPDYTTAQTILEVSSIPILGTISIALNEPTIEYGESTTAIVTLSNSSGQTAFPVTVVSENEDVATISPPSCNISSESPSCQVSVIAGSQTNTAIIVASASGYISTQITITVATNIWTWISGSNLVSQFGIYGTQGIASIDNVPGSRAASTSWVDNLGNMWLFGGYGYDNLSNTVFFNDLWKYNPDNKTWAWISGSNSTNQFGTYGSKGVPSVNNIPGSRAWSVSWIDGSNNMWIFGGNNNTSSGGRFNDLWRYNPADNTWTWVSGSDLMNQTGIYGSKGVPDTNNTPGSRSGAISWTDHSGNLWLFGGYGSNNTGSAGYFNDLWKYTPLNSTWTWISGSNTTNQSAVYGTRGIPSINNIPGARAEAVSWIDNSGNLWLFGGYGYGYNMFAQPTLGWLNDLWKYNPTNNTWTWVNGLASIDQSPIYGTQGVTNINNSPGSRSGAISWTDRSGNLWIFGGYNYNNFTNPVSYFSDLWKYTPISNSWTWVSGSNLVNQPGIYGTQYITSTSNAPGARLWSISWISSSGDLWLFGGYGYDSTGIPGNLNDLWVNAQ